LSTDIKLNMLGLGRRRGDERKDQVNSLLILKNKLQKEKVGVKDVPGIDSMKFMENKMDDILLKIRELEKKVETVKRERITEFMELEKLTTKSMEKGESVRTLKIKSMIKSLLSEHGKLSCEELARMVKLSRNRCNEYLKELERAGTVEGTRVRRKRFYSLVKK
jgi:Mn-dependent DtxR family transcriptional regulator